MKRVQNNRAQHNSTLDAVTNTEQQERTESEAVTVTETQTEEGYRKITEVFDTTQPVDPQTKTPPLQERVTEEYGRTQLKKQDKVEETTTEVTLNISEDIKLEEQAEEISERTEQKGLTTLQRTLICVGILAVIAVLVWLALKIKNRLKLL